MPKGWLSVHKQMQNLLATFLCDAELETILSPICTNAECVMSTLVWLMLYGNPPASIGTRFRAAAATTAPSWVRLPCIGRACCASKSQVRQPTCTTKCNTENSCQGAQNNDNLSPQFLLLCDNYYFYLSKNIQKSIFIKEYQIKLF